MLTLDDCQETGYKMDSTSVVRRRYHAYMVLSGAPFAEGEPLEFDSATVRLRHMREWVNRSGLDVVRGRRNCIRISYAPITPYVATTSWREFEIAFPWEFRRSNFESAIEQDCSATFRFIMPQCIEKILRFSSSLWHLVTIGIDSPIAVKNMTLSHADERREVELYTTWNESGMLG